jgi:hypothetical protein
MSDLSFCRCQYTQQGKCSSASVFMVNRIMSLLCRQCSQSLHLPAKDGQIHNVPSTYQPSYVVVRHPPDGRLYPVLHEATACHRSKQKNCVPDLHAFKDEGSTFIQNVWIQLPREKGKGKFHPGTCHEGPNVKCRISSTISLTSALDWGGGQRPAPAVLPPSKRHGTGFTEGEGGPEPVSSSVTQRCITKEWNPHNIYTRLSKKP